MNYTSANHKMFFTSVLLAFIAFIGCKTSTSPINSGGPGGTLYFNAANGAIGGAGTNDIIALNFTTGVTTRIITGDYPCITPDHKIVFSNVTLQECDFSGQNVRVIASDPLSEYARPQVSLDGRYVAFGKSNYIDIVDRSNGTLVSELIATPGTYGNPTWTNGGSVIAQAAYMNYGLWITSTTGITKIPGNYDNAKNPRSNAAGTEIVFSMTGNIYSINIDGSNLKEIVSNIGECAPIWSPDGKYVAYGFGVKLFYADVATGT